MFFFAFRCREALDRECCFRVFFLELRNLSSKVEGTFCIGVDVFQDVSTSDEEYETKQTNRNGAHVIIEASNCSANSSSSRDVGKGVMIIASARHGHGSGGRIRRENEEHLPNMGILFPKKALFRVRVIGEM